ncbi:MAG TPA: hypothetical protein VNG12_14260 [Acidimicrobiales bacterium]|nr:hypothetical protein [Acidimicrobiales bacterium]
MPQRVGNDLEWHAHGEEERGARVAQLVDAPVPEAGPLADPRHGATEGLGIERGADRGGEHQVGGVAPDASCLLLGVLTGPLDPQEVDEGLGQVQRASAAGGL